MCHTINVGQLDFIGNSCGCWRRIGDRAQFTCLLSSEKKVKCLRLIRQCFTTDQTKGQILDYGHTTRVVIVLSFLFSLPPVAQKRNAASYYGLILTSQNGKRCRSDYSIIVTDLSFRSIKKINVECHCYPPKQNCNVEQTSTLRRDFHCRVVLLVSTDLNFKA